MFPQCPRVAAKRGRYRVKRKDESNPPQAHGGREGLVDSCSARRGAGSQQLAEVHRQPRDGTRERGREVERPWTTRFEARSPRRRRTRRRHGSERAVFGPTSGPLVSMRAAGRRWRPSRGRCRGRSCARGRDTPWRRAIRSACFDSCRTPASRSSSPIRRITRPRRPTSTATRRSRRTTSISRGCGRTRRSGSASCGPTARSTSSPPRRCPPGSRWSSASTSSR